MSNIKQDKKDTRKRYKTVCCNCKNVMYSCKSLGQEIGMMDTGYGRCIHCNISIALIFNPENDTMDTLLWDEYIKQKK